MEPDNIIFVLYLKRERKTEHEQEKALTIE